MDPRLTALRHARRSLIRPPRVAMAPGPATPPQHALPPLTTQARTLLGAAAGMVGDVLTGRPPRVSAEVREARLALCQACPELRSNGRCSACGCHVKAKTWIRRQACPLGKWLAGDNDEESPKVHE